MGSSRCPAREGSDEDLGLANVILPNGARYYVDHAHPEYSTPECISVRGLVVHDKAGERILERSLDEVVAAMPSAPRLSIYKNNSDGKGNSYGTHENYLVDRATPFGDIVRDLTPFFVTRIVFTGAGKVGAEAQWDDRGQGIYQLTQRADFFETEVGLETTLKRPIINTRDEPHADPEKYRRLHVIVGDANLCEISTFLKTRHHRPDPQDDRGSLPARPHRAEPGPGPPRRLPRRHVHPRDRAGGRPPGRTRCSCSGSTSSTRRSTSNARTTPPENREIVDRWESVLAALETDPSTLHRQLDWVAKQRLLEAYRDRDGLAWGDPKLRAIDLQYHDVRRDKGLYYRLEATGKVERLTTDEEIETAVMEPPIDTRAYFRGRCIGKYPDAIAAASWDSLIVDTGQDALQRIPMREPLRGTKAHVDELLEAVTTRRRWLPTSRAEPRSPQPSVLGLRCRLGRIGPLFPKERAMPQEQEQKKVQRKGGGDGDGSTTTPVRSQSSGKAAELKEEMDDILDEIDSVLEENAEEFVKSYVQKGGE